jgi:two-component system, NarL family, response regulator LiaR
LKVLIKKVNEPLTPGQDLTDREKEVLALMVEGLSNTEIAARLNISHSTAKFHVGNIISKLGVNGRTEAVAVAVKNQLVKGIV